MKGQLTQVLTRRALLGGGISALGMAALAEGPQTTVRPVARPGTEPLADLGNPPARPETRLRARPSSESLVAEAGLGGAVGFVLADARTGAVLEARQADVPLPPASVMKAVTALYALDALGEEHRFVTRLIGVGQVTEGVTGRVLEGDLVLMGGGDPTLSTDDLAEMAAALRRIGLTEVRGAFRVWGGRAAACARDRPRAA
jgi:serine-type D-Ala-D-Ala carboxypeptidase/endopeptidase (penicillin-binding protein 4)